MNIDLAAFRLNALASLTASNSSGTNTSRSGTDFLNTLLDAKRALVSVSGSNSGSAASALSALTGTGGGLSQLESVLSRLEASNSTFMRNYSARVAEIGDEATVLAQLRERMSTLGTASQSLGALDTTASDADVKATLRDFITRYNQWDTEFDPYFEDGALLDDNQAGEVARFSLRREVGSIFNGAGKGGYELGLTDMGVSFSKDGQLQLDEAAFDAALAGDRNAALQTLANVAKGFGDAARVLASDGHLLDRRIDNAERAVAWAADNQNKVDAEFGPGAVSARIRGALD